VAAPDRLEKGVPPARRALPVAAALAAAGFVALVTWCYQRALLHHEQFCERFVVVFADAACQQPVARLPAMTGLESTGPAELAGVRQKFGGYTPVIRWGQRYRCRVPGSGAEGFVMPTLPYSGRWRIARPADDGFRAWMVPVTALLAGLAVYLLTAHHRRLAAIIAGAGLLRLATLCWSYALFGFYSIHAGDESHYINVASKLIDSETQLWGITTLGTSLLQLPLWYVYQDAGELVFTRTYAFVNLAVFGVGVLGCVAGLCRLLTNSSRLAAAAAAAVALYPWLFRLHHNAGELFAYTGLDTTFPADMASASFYYLSDFIGYNAMSDTPALFFGLLAVLLMFVQLRRGGNLAIAGAAFGFACLTRIASIYVSIPLALLWWRENPQQSWRQLFWCGGAFAVMLAPQLIWNQQVYGSPFTLGYAKQQADAAGFELSQLLTGATVVAEAHTQLLALAALALAVGWRRQQRWAALLALLLLPTLLFYSGYHAIGMNPVRFLILPLTMMMAALPLLWPVVPGRAPRLLALAALVYAAAIVPGRDLITHQLELAGAVMTALGLILAMASLLGARSIWYAAFFVALASGVPLVAYLFLCLVCALVIGLSLLACKRPPGDVKPAAASAPQSLSIVIPVFNEQDTVADVIAAVDAVALPGNMTKEIVVVNDGSSDGTRAALDGIDADGLQASLQIVHFEQNQGKGAAVRHGFDTLAGDVLIIQDADLELSPEQYPELLAPIIEDGAQVVYGSRFLDRPWVFSVGYLANRFLTALTNILYGGELTDMETCFKTMRASVARQLDLVSDRFDIEPEITAKLLKLGVDIHEVPVHYNPRGRDEGKKIGFADGIEAIGALLRWRWHR
jgi:hypothetical protein